MDSAAPSSTFVFFSLPVLITRGKGALCGKGLGVGAQHLYAGGFGCTQSMITHRLLSSKNI